MCCVNISEKEISAYKKMNKEQLSIFLHMLKRGYISKNKKAHTRKLKHKKWIGELE